MPDVGKQPTMIARVEAHIRFRDIPRIAIEPNIRAIYEIEHKVLQSERPSPCCLDENTSTMVLLWNAKSAGW